MKNNCIGPNCVLKFLRKIKKFYTNFDMFNVVLFTFTRYEPKSPLVLKWVLCGSASLRKGWWRALVLSHDVLLSPVIAGLHHWHPFMYSFLTRVYVCAQGPSSHGQRVHEGPEPAADDVLPSPVPAGLRSGNAFRSASPRHLSRLSTWWVIFMDEFRVFKGVRHTTISCI